LRRWKAAQAPRCGQNPPATRDTDYSTAPAALIFANVRGLSLRDVRVIWDAPGAPSDRHAIYAGGVEDFTISGFAGAPRRFEAGRHRDGEGPPRICHSIPNRSRDAVVHRFEWNAGGEVVLSGNDCAKAARVIGAGGTYVHLPQ